MMKRIIGISVLIFSLLWGTIPAHATEIAVSDTTTGTTPTSFVATNDMLQNNVVVSIPAEMVLTYNATTKKLTDTESVSVRGDIKSGKHLEVSVPTNVAYQSSGNYVNGVLTFGTTSGGRGTETWTPTQASSSSNSRQITSTVNASDLDYAGTYSTTITFSISIVND